MIVMLSRTNKGMDFRVWKISLHNDDQYSICVFYFFTFHVLFFLLLISLLKTSLKSPGYLDKKYVRVIYFYNILLVI